MGEPRCLGVDINRGFEYRPSVMGLFDFFAKNSRLWQVNLLLPDGSMVSVPPEDRHGAMGIMVDLREGVKIDRVTFAGKPISQTQLEDLVFDGHFAAFLVDTARKQGVSIETLTERGIDKVQMEAVAHEVLRRVSKTLRIRECDSLEILLRRCARGTAAILSQRTP